MAAHEKWMARALELARRGKTSPNPMVGAVLVRKDKVVGEGFHRRAGQPHAEIAALKQAGARARGATLYVTLEPCCHFGRTGPCTEALIAAGIKKAVVAHRDPNPLIAGKGLKILRQAGIATDVGCLASQARWLNRFYLTWIGEGRPYVIAKAAVTVNGKIALRQRTPTVITGSLARKAAHALRAQVDAILVGRETLATDNPKLTARHGFKNPHLVRIILDPQAQAPASSRVFQDGAAPTLWVVGETAEKRAQKAAGRFKKVKVISSILDISNCFKIDYLLDQLGQMGLVSLIVEGGAKTLNFFHPDWVDEWRLFYAPRFFPPDALDLLSDRAGAGSQFDAIWHFQGFHRHAQDWEIVLTKKSF